MTDIDAAATAETIVRPPLLWLGLAVLGAGLDWLYPSPFLPEWISPIPTGGAIFAIGLIAAVVAIVQFQIAGTRVETYRPTTAIVPTGIYRISRNPIYAGMLIGQLGIAVGSDNLWQLAMLVPQFLVLRYGVIAREEIYLERKFGDIYLDYKARVRRWL